MNEEEGADQVKPCWFIDLNWHQQNSRSFSALARDCLCPKCRERSKKLSADELLTAIKDCCSEAADFISGKSPVLENIFRLFLANGNQPLDSEDLGKQLRERCGGGSYRTSAEVLSRLLRDERYYGIRQV